ncbi:hypothetical protein C1637_11935 [Chryseobacterium lactis]|uniref:Lipoprotein n=1 Tax=Chryseobacterium lactis TaxID=1241981 RepID=A0A3G6RV54_CHRLC|nr:hypothetical protein [Chryseobacterium lactis]AZA80762.1 hypothetical protein EG342_02005 [Chryseobacterium lactis]AZB05764.1 hypothetical protein EG341_18130 [Chryseobacterium lactis]PNW13517.1 hypothetical protein C1637_11935 [Chryseobacterium lactis]
MKASTAFFLFLLLLCCFSCESDEAKLARAEKECAAKTKIDGLTISFFGYFPKDVDSVSIQIKRGNNIVKNYSDPIPTIISDSLRHQRTYYLKNEIKLTDTVFIKIKNEPVKKLYDFKYLVRAHFTMMNRNWGCDFYELKADGKVYEGSTFDITRKNWKIIERKDFKNYYQK